MTDTVTIAMIAAVASTVASVMGFLNRVGIDRAVKKSEDIHTLVNSRMTELLSLTRAASKAEGVKEGERTSASNGEKGS